MNHELYLLEATGDTLFDEKIGGTMHMALGASLPESGGINDSALHWDLVCDLYEGKVYADGENSVTRTAAFSSNE